MARKSLQLETRRVKPEQVSKLTKKKQATELKQRLTRNCNLRQPGKIHQPCIVLSEQDMVTTPLQRSFLSSGTTYNPTPKELVNHPSHYGGENNTYEVIKVIEAWELNFNLGNTVKYIGRAGKKDDILKDLQKAAFYLNREIEKLKNV